MTEPHSTAPVPPGKPVKPSPDYPLTAHSAGYWCKKIKGKTHYFGKWTDPEGALRNYHAFLAGKPVEKTGRSPGESADKPAKPYPEFPLFSHATGQWAKKIRGQLHYFGVWADPDAALAKYLERKDDLHAGRTPHPDLQAVTVKDVVNAFLIHKRDKVDAGELSIRTWAKYKEVTDLLVAQLGTRRLAADLRPDDFTRLKNLMAKRWGPLRVGDFVQHIRSVFKHAFEAELLAQPVRFGPGFARPSQKTLRLHRAKQGPKLFSAAEVHQLLGAADVQLKAMILLGINAGYGNADCGSLPLAALDLEGGWVDYPRPKTGLPRRCPLWPETVVALREALARRPRPKKEEYAGLAFLSERGTPRVSVREKDRTDGVAVQFGAILRRLGINGRTGLGFYTLRHTFRTIADEAKDQPAADFIMGHEVPHMSSVYRETISDERLKAVADHVRAWLFAEKTPAVE
jgi:integrase